MKNRIIRILTAVDRLSYVSGQNDFKSDTEIRRGARKINYEPMLSCEDIAFHHTNESQHSVPMNPINHREKKNGAT